MVSISVSETIERSDLFGSMDRFLHMIEDRFGCVIIQRDNELLVRGEQAGAACEVIREMIGTLEKGEQLDQQKVNYIMELKNEGLSYSDENPSQDIICFTHEGRPLRPKTIGQKEYVRKIRKMDIVFGIGPAGTGKTFLAVLMAVSYFKKGKISKIIITRPAVEAGESLGYLPGDLKEKIDPYLMPIYDALDAILGGEQKDKMIEKGTIEVIPLAYMRGRTLDEAFIILDEAQNTTDKQMLMFLTRLGFNSKMVVNGDITQIDLNISRTRSGLKIASEKLQDIPGIGFIEFTNSDVDRNPLVQKIIEKFNIE